MPNDFVLHRTLDILASYSTLVVETYVGVEDELFDRFVALGFDCVIHTKDLFIASEKMNEWLEPILTKDRVFGRMYFGDWSDFMDPQAVKRAQHKMRTAKRCLVYGVGANLVCSWGTLVMVDMTRWEIQLRYRQGLSNFNVENSNEDFLRKYKRGYFFEWRLCDKLKQHTLNQMAYYLDASEKGVIKMISHHDFHNGLDIFGSEPFRLVPYFDPGVWGGHWMQSRFKLPENNSNYAWSFDGVPEENAICFQIGDDYIYVPATNLVLLRPYQLMGERVVSRFGYEFPIRFDYLDTMGGQNLSLQVHPDVQTIYREFGMAYTQSESYYIMQASENSAVYLGCKTGIDKKGMFDELTLAKRGDHLFEVEKYVNKFVAKKHDHFLIPPGTIHCSGANTVVLEISQTPYIFTFKLWDWGRVGLDGLPRPVHLELGERVLREDIDTSFVMKHCINQSHIIYEHSGNRIEVTGLTSGEALHTTRISLSSPMSLQNEGCVSMMNLVEGECCEIVTDKCVFDVYFGETFIVPARIDEFIVRSKQPIVLIRAQVR